MEPIMEPNLLKPTGEPDDLETCMSGSVGGVCKSTARRQLGGHLPSQECIKFATENPVCYIATTDGDQPRVRAVLMWFADESGFYFVPLSPKQMTKQLHKNPKTEICFYNNPPELPQAKAMRITGEVEFLEDQELIEKAYENRKFLDDLVGKPVKEFIEVFRIKSGDAHFWTMMDVLKEPQLEHLKF